MKISSRKSAISKTGGRPNPPAELTPGKIRGSHVYRTYQCRVSYGSGLPLFMSGEETLPASRSENCNPFCELVQPRSGSCSTCPLNRLPDLGQAPPETLESICPAGFQTAAVPILQGGVIVVWLITGQVPAGELEGSDYGHVRPELERLGLTDSMPLRQAFLASRRMPAPVFERAVSLLEIIAGLLEQHENTMMLEAAGIRFARSRLERAASAMRPDGFRTGDSGMTAAEIDERIGMEAACLAMRSKDRGNCTVGTLARLSGCGSARAFRRRFDHYFHESPEAYRLRSQGYEQRLREWVTWRIS